MNLNVCHLSFVSCVHIGSRVHLLFEYFIVFCRPTRHSQPAAAQFRIECGVCCNLFYIKKGLRPSRMMFGLNWKCFQNGTTTTLKWALGNNEDALKQWNNYYLLDQQPFYVARLCNLCIQINLFFADPSTQCWSWVLHEMHNQFVRDVLSSFWYNQYLHPTPCSLLPCSLRVRNKKKTA